MLAPFPDIARSGYIVQAVIPEPATLSFLGLGLAGLAVVRRRRKK